MEWYHILLIVLGAILVILGVLYFVGRKMMRKQGEAAEAMENAKQVASILVIDKKMMKIGDAGLPQIAVDSTPKYLRWKKFPMVKGKIGPKVMTFVADKEVFNALPIKKEVKVELSGLYITGIKSVRNGSIQPTKKQLKAKEKAEREKAKADKAKAKAGNSGSGKNGSGKVIGSKPKF